MTLRPLPSPLRERLELAVSAFAEKGFEATRMEDVAEVTGVPKATLYYHFQGKEQILAWLLASLLRDVADEVQRAIAGPQTALLRLESIVRAQLRVMAARPGACRVLLFDLSRAGRIPEIAAAIGEAFLLPVARLLAEGRADGSIGGPTDDEATSAAIYGAVTVTGLHYLLAHGTLDAEHVGDIVAGLLTHGLRAS
ncbi:MAG TPA: TetR/AcrR family transcriptional regulator [Candidatus Dormibacteraeota bacterium]|nr:TetR/AcrR family transcriptional regulator [Candidatus Dormibacteraeota bacterium]